ncbi:MAG: M20/M25/M40 family metallo-hydrolase, partial [Deltaproteobacteria bacterium]
HVMPRLRDGTGYNAASSARTDGPSKAARKGAVGFLVRSASTGSTRVPHTGALHYQPNTAHIPAAALSVPDAELLNRTLASGADVSCELTLGCKPLPDGESDNVIGELPGTDRAWEIVLLGAHLDSWDVGTGALDDAAGCAIALEVARLLAGLPGRPRRTVRIVLFGNEELGSGGGRGYADRHRDEAQRHVAAMEADQGDGRPWALRVPQDRRDSRATRVLHAALEPLGIALDHGQARGGVDILPLRDLGVPFVDLRQDATTYFDYHHSASDVLEAVSCEDLEASAVAFAAAVWVLANMEDSFAGR